MCLAGLAGSHLAGVSRGADAGTDMQQSRTLNRVNRHEREIAELQRKVKALETAQRSQDGGGAPKATMNLHVAAKKDSVSQLRFGLNAGAKVDLRDPSGATPLMIACEAGNIRAARYLLVNGADPMAKDKEGGSPLSYAEKGGKQALSTLLIEYGAR